MNKFFCLGSICLLNEPKTNVQAWFIYKQTNMNELFIELSSICSWLVWFIYNPGIGCPSVCQNISNVGNDSCSGIRCCQIDISKGMQSITLAANSFNKHTKIWDFNPCRFAFDDAENTTSKSHGPWALLMTPAQRKERIFAECTGVVPAKYPPKIKLELFSLL